jgi:hypothetical protein
MEVVRHNKYDLHIREQVVRWIVDVIYPHPTDIASRNNGRNTEQSLVLRGVILHMAGGMTPVSPKMIYLRP